MSEHPILFTGNMIRAILDGHKTQTRRIAKLPKKWHRGKTSFKGNPHGNEEFIIYGDCGTKTMYCPHGRVGDTLWVRETWAITSHQETPPPTAEMILYKADGMKFDAGTNWSAYGYNIKWKPSIFMPKVACRIFLEITDIRVERVQEISKIDIFAEGTPRPMRGKLNCHAAIQDFWILWDSINAKRAPWKDNPYVWVVEFRRKSKGNPGRR